MPVAADIMKVLAVAAGMTINKGKNIYYDKKEEPSKIGRLFLSSTYQRCSVQRWHIIHVKKSPYFCWTLLKTIALYSFFT